MANSPARSTVDVGSVIADTYTIEALIGQGGMGSVFLASHNRLPGKSVAIKLLHAELQDKEVIARFKREAEIASRLNHPNIVAVHDFNVTPDGTPYLVLELLQGESLAQRLVGGALPLEMVFSIARQVGSALAAAHREGIVHRDLKPANIFLCPTEVDGKLVEIAKVLDFGISKMRDSQTVKTQESTLLGTPQYMSPEQAKGDHANVTSRTDVFALGAIVYEMLAGHPAFAGENIPEVVFKVVYEQPLPLVTEAPTAPANVIATVEQAMAKAAAERFSSVSMFVEKLTGEKVALVRTPSMPPLDDGGPRGRSTGKEAYDHTMASGDHGRAPTPLPIPGPAIDVQANTVASLSSDDPAPSFSVPPAIGVPTIVMPDPSIARRPSRVPMIAIALGGAAIGAIVLYFVMRGGGDPKPHADAATVAIADAAPVAPPTVDAAIAAIDAAPIAVDASVVVVAADAAARPVDAAVKRPSDTSGEEPAPLAQAFGAYRKGDYETAARVAAELLVSSTPLGPFQRARASAIEGAASCKLNNFQQGKIRYRQLAGFPQLRAMVVEACGASVAE
jgi:eukaryotic-like serine/threonine-protein kinase